MKGQKLFLIIFLAGLLFFPLISRADGVYEINLCADGKGALKTANGKCEPDEYDDPGELEEAIVCYQGLVPCGKPVFLNGRLDAVGHCDKTMGSSAEISCKFCHFPVTVLGVINFLILPPTVIVFIIAVLLLVAGGAMFIFSAGRPALAGQAKRIMTATVIGLVIIYASWLIVNTFLSYVGLSDFGLEKLGKWSEVIFNCPIYVPKP